MKYAMTVMQTIDLMLALRIKDIKTNCWNFVGKTFPNGYGSIQYKRKTVAVHRVIANVCLGFDLKSKLQVLHKCDNRRCFNPEHLFIGTNMDNRKDMMNKRRHRNQKKTHCVNGHEFTPENTYINETSRGARQCKQCTLDRGKKYRKG